MLILHKINHVCSTPNVDNRNFKIIQLQTNTLELKQMHLGESINSMACCHEHVHINKPLNDKFTTKVYGYNGGYSSAVYTKKTIKYI